MYFCDYNLLINIYNRIISIVNLLRNGKIYNNYKIFSI
jgi:hypothetical protein